MKLKDLFPQVDGANQESAANQNDFIPKLKSHRYIELPDVEAANKALDPKLHDINDTILRPDKKVKIDKDDDVQDSDSAKKIIDTGEDNGTYRTEKVARVAVALQKLITRLHILQARTTKTRNLSRKHSTASCAMPRRNP